MQLDKQAGKKKGVLGNYEIRARYFLNKSCLEQRIRKRIKKMQISAKAYGYEILTTQLQHPSKAKNGQGFNCQLSLYAISFPHLYEPQNLQI